MQLSCLPSSTCMHSKPHTSLSLKVASNKASWWSCTYTVQYLLYTFSFRVSIASEARKRNRRRRRRRRHHPQLIPRCVWYYFTTTTSTGRGEGDCGRGGGRKSRKEGRERVVRSHCRDWSWLVQGDRITVDAKK